MATIDQFRTATSSARPSLFAQLFAAVAAWQERRATVDALSRLTDRELDDLGLTRAAVADIAAGKRPAARI